jgi:serpin B
MKRVGVIGFLLCSMAAAVLADPTVPTEASRDNSAVKMLTAAYNFSGQQLFGQFAKQPGNIVFSPYSIGTVMAMALSGARGETAAEMTRVLGHRQPVAAMEAANSQAMAILNGYDHGADPWTCPPGMTVQDHRCEATPAGGARPCAVTMQLEGDRCIGNAKAPRSAKLHSANALMLTTRIATINADYADLLHTRYGAEVFEDAKLADINAWVSRKTEGKIDTILDRLDPTATLVLLNAVYFKARWAQEFNKALTKDDTFNVTREQKIQVPMMNHVGAMALAARNGYRALRLPYEIALLGLVVILPDDIDGAGEVARRLDDAEVTSVLATLQAPAALTPVTLTLPRFKTYFEANLVPAFKLAGINQAFDDAKADFSGMIGMPFGNSRDGRDRRAHIDQIIHRAIIEVAEESTEAAAVTAVRMPIAAASPARPPPPPVPFRVDRPFLFFLVDNASGAILFEGRISDPR